MVFLLADRFRSVFQWTYIHKKYGVIQIVNQKAVLHRLSRLWLKGFHNHRNALTAANARSGKPVAQALSAQFIQHGDHQAGPRRTERMSESNRSTIHVCTVAL